MTVNRGGGVGGVVISISIGIGSMKSSRLIKVVELLGLFQISYTFQL